jgi:hypothetical protein
MLSTASVGYPTKRSTGPQQRHLWKDPRFPKADDQWSAEISQGWRWRNSAWELGTAASHRQCVLRVPESGDTCPAWRRKPNELKLSRAEDPHYLIFVGLDRFGECSLIPFSTIDDPLEFRSRQRLISRSATNSEDHQGDPNIDIFAPDIIFV